MKILNFQGKNESLFEMRKESEVDFLQSLLLQYKESKFVISEFTNYVIFFVGSTYCIGNYIKYYKLYLRVLKVWRITTKK
jgi:hypothetical protein